MVVTTMFMINLTILYCWHRYSNMGCVFWPCDYDWINRKKSIFIFHLKYFDCCVQYAALFRGIYYIINTIINLQPTTELLKFPNHFYQRVAPISWLQKRWVSCKDVTLKHKKLVIKKKYKVNSINYPTYCKIFIKSDYMIKFHWNLIEFYQFYPLFCLTNNFYIMFPIRHSFKSVKIWLNSNYSQIFLTNIEWKMTDCIGENELPRRKKSFLANITDLSINITRFFLLK